MINALFSSSSSSFRWPVLSPARNAQLLSELSTPERIRLRFQLLHFNLSQVRSPINATRHISNNCACTFAGVSRLSCTHPAKLSTRLEWKRIRGWPRDLNYPSHWYSVHQFSKIWTKIFPAKEFRKNEKRLPFPRWYEVTLWKSRAKDDTFYRYREEFVTVGGEVEKRKKGRQMDGGYRVPCTVLPSLPLPWCIVDTLLMKLADEPVAKLPRSPPAMCWYANLFTDSIYEVGQPCKPSC